MSVLHDFEHPERTLRPVAELEPPEHDHSLPGFMVASRPVVLRGYHRDDPALAAWSLPYLMERLPDAEIDLDVGDAMVTDGLTFETMTLHGYLRSLIAAERSEGQVRYLQGYNIFAHAPSLYDEIRFPHLARTAARQVRAGWIGPAGTVTGYHADIGDNQLSQVLGRKLVKLVSPDQQDRVYRTRKYDPNGVACAVNADAWDSSAHPRFAETDAQYVVLEPGDSVYIPGGWFHYVRSIDTSISVNHIGYTRRQLLVGKTADQVRRLLHNVGLYGDTCTCHMTVDGERIARR